MYTPKDLLIVCANLLVHLTCQDTKQDHVSGLAIRCVAVLNRAERCIGFLESLLQMQSSKPFAPIIYIPNS